MIVRDTPAEIAAEGAAWIVERARVAVAARGVFRVALAGGDSPKALYEAIAATPGLDASRWEFYLGDERAVPESDPRSNLRAARASLIEKVRPPNDRVHPMYIEGMDLDAMALAYDRSAPEVFDVVILGLGKDAHTLSLHPGCAAIGERGRSVVAVHAPPMDPAVDRITLTPPVVERARAVLLLAHGAGKAAAVRAVFEGPDDRTATPAQIVRDARGEVLVLLDAAAASQLARA